MKSERVYFIEETHSYYGCDSGLKYESVSGVAKKVLEPPVDWNAILIRKAEKLGIAPEELQADWDRKKLLGTQAGTAAHAAEEAKLFSNKFSLWNNDIFEVVPYETDGDKKLQIQQVSKGKCYPELILTLVKDHMRVAGQSDGIFIDDDGYAHCRDYKSDKELTYKGFRGKTLREPFDYLQDCNMSYYSVKMSMYLFMLLQSNPDLKPGKIELEWIPLERDADGVPVFDEGGSPTVVDRKIIEIDYKEWEPTVLNVLNEYYKLTKV